MQIMKRLVVVGVLAVAAGVIPESVFAAAATPESIIVLPARKRIVHLAFQIAQCKDVGLVAYNNNPTLPAPLIHVWNGQEWVQVTAEEYQQGAFMSGEPKHVFIIGDHNALPPQMTALPDWAKNAEVIPSMGTADIVNKIGQALKFSGRQWQWIAQANDLSVADQNAERRRYGRWGAPGKEVDLSPAKKIEEVELPPAPVAEKPVKSVKEALAEEQAAETKPVKKAESKPAAETKKQDQPKKTDEKKKDESKAVKKETPAKAEEVKKAEPAKKVEPPKPAEIKAIKEVAKDPKGEKKVEAVKPAPAKPAEAPTGEVKPATAKPVEPKAGPPAAPATAPEAAKPSTPAKVEYQIEKVAAPVPPVVEKPDSMKKEPAAQVEEEAPEAK